MGLIPTHTLYILSVHVSNFVTEDVLTVKWRRPTSSRCFTLYPS